MKSPQSSGQRHGGGDAATVPYTDLARHTLGAYAAGAGLGVTLSPFECGACHENLTPARPLARLGTITSPSGIPTGYPLCEVCAARAATNKKAEAEVLAAVRKTAAGGRIRMLHFRPPQFDS